MPVIVRWLGGAGQNKRQMTDTKRVYLDHSATTPVHPEVAEAMLPYLTQKFGNPSSVHSFGQEARAAVDRSRREVAALIGARPNEVVFVSGGTEANNLAIRGVCELAISQRGHLITADIEHPSVRGIHDTLEKKGWKVTRVAAGPSGVVRAEDVHAAITPETVLISVMFANNEIGTIQPVQEIAELVQRERAGGLRMLFHVDAVQAAGRIPVNVEKLGCDLMSISAHKMYGPKGAGALFIRRGVRLAPQNVGGHQERERRAGTESVPSIVGFGAAARLAKSKLEERFEHDQRLRNLFEQKVTDTIDDIVFNGDRSKRLPHLSNISFRFIEGEGLLISLDLQGIAVSTGSACSSGTLEPSPVIRALGHNDEMARGSIRFSFGEDNAEDDVNYVVQTLARSVQKLRQLSPLNKPPRLEPVAAK